MTSVAPLTAEALQSLAIETGVVTSAAQAGSNWLADSTKHWGVNVHRNRLVKIIAGQGMGQTAIILSNVLDGLVIRGTWLQPIAVGASYMILSVDIAQVMRDVLGGGANISAANPLEVHDPKVGSLISYEGITTADGAGGGASLICAALAALPDYDGNQVIVTSGACIGQARDVNGITTGGTVTPHLAFGAQILDGTHFVIAAIRTTPAEVAALTLIAQVIDYGDAVHYDSAGSPGTAWPIGTPTNPCSSLANVRTILAALSLHKIIVHGDLTLDAAMNGYHFIGFNPIDDTVALDINGQDVDNSVFENLYIVGAMGGGGYYPFFRNCSFGTINPLRGWAVGCLVEGDITLAAGGEVGLWDCSAKWSNCTINVGTGSLYVYNFQGQVQLANMTGGGSEFFAGGSVYLRNTCTGGVIQIGLNVGILDDSAGTTVRVLGREQKTVPVNITAIVAGETAFLDIDPIGNFSSWAEVRSLRLKCADPGVNTVTVRLYQTINDVGSILVDSFDIDATNFATHHSLMDMFGLQSLIDQRPIIRVQASAGGPYAVTGQYSFARH